MEARAAWEALEPEWRRCLELAWASYREGSVGVGALLVDPNGTVVSEGRSRWHEEHRTTPDLSGGKLAHAETEALARIPNDVRLDGHTLWTSMEPCLLCTGATIVAHVGAVRYLGADHLWAGVERLPELNPFVAHRWPLRHGPRRDQFGMLGTVIPLASVAREFRTRPGPSYALRAQRRVDARWADLAESSVDRLDGLAAAGEPVVAAVEELWGQLTRLA